MEPENIKKKNSTNTLVFNNKLKLLKLVVFKQINLK